jgi:putative transposase
MTASIRLEQGQCWEFRGQRLRFERELGDGMLHFTVERTLAPLQVDDPAGGKRAPDINWMLVGLASGELKRVADQYGTLARRLAESREHDAETIVALDPDAPMRRFVLRHLDEISEIKRGHRAIRAALDKLWADHPEKVAGFRGKPPARTVRRWLNTRGSPGDRALRQMMSMSSRVTRARRLPPETVALLKRQTAWYWAYLGRSIEDAYAGLTALVSYINRRRRQAGNILPPLILPSREILRREIRASECWETYRVKFGDKKARVRFKGCGAGLAAMRFLSLGCMDHTPLDGVAVIDADWMLPVGRPYLTVIIDVHTRCIVGFVLTFEPPSLYSVLECIKRANRPKLHMLARSPRYPVLASIFGRFDELVVDNGWEFVGTAFEDAMADVGTSVRWAPVASPTYKAIVERFFGVLNHLLNRKLPGGVFKPEFLREIGHDPYKDAVLTIEELEDLIWSAIEYYHVRLHKGIGTPPAQAWQRDMDAHGIAIIGDDVQLEKMAGAMKYPCRLTRSGVEFSGLQFHDQGKTSGLLNDLVGIEPVRNQRIGSGTATVKIKYNPANLAQIHVWNLRRNRYVTLPCTDEKYAAGISAWHHKKLKQWALDQGYAFNSEEERLLARAALTKRIEDAAPGLKLRRRRAMMRLLSAPRVEQSSTGVVGLAYAPARHDGMAAIIPHDALANERTDEGQPSSRPGRKKKPKAKVRKSSPNARRADDGSPSSSPPSGLHFGPDPSGDWEGLS